MWEFFFWEFEVIEMELNVKVLKKNKKMQKSGYIPTEIQIIFYAYLKDLNLDFQLIFEIFIKSF